VFLICSSAKSISVGMLVKEGQVDVVCPEGLIEVELYIQSEKVDGCKHHANGDGLT